MSTTSRLGSDQGWALGLALLNAAFPPQRRGRAMGIFGGFLQYRP